jgi:hypothetical protein
MMSKDVGQVLVRFYGSPETFPTENSAEAIDDR